MGILLPFPKFPDPKVRRFPVDGDVRILGDAIIASDWHAPFHDLDLASKLLDVQAATGITQLIIPGDFFDASTLSTYDKVGISHTIKEELLNARETLRLLSSRFRKVYWSPGNHEARLLRRLDFALDLPDVIDFLTPDLQAMHPVELPQLVLMSAGVKFRITHPRSYSTVTAKIAAELADIFDCHVMSAHGHHLGFAYSKSGKYLGMDLGGMFDTEKVPYINVGGDTTHPRWNPGFWTVQQGYPQAFSKELTNWDRYDASLYYWEDRRPQASVNSGPEIVFCKNETEPTITTITKAA